MQYEPIDRPIFRTRHDLFTRNSRRGLLLRVMAVTFVLLALLPASTLAL